MASLYGKPPMLRTKTPGLLVGWKQGIYEKQGVGTLWMSVLGETQYRFCPVPKQYYNDLLNRHDAEVLMNQIMVMYGTD